MNTPETDKRAWSDHSEGILYEVVEASFARKLERERDKAQEDATNYYAKIGELEQERDEARHIARDLCETVSYLAPDLLNRDGYTFEKAAVMRCLDMLNEDPEANFRGVTENEAAK